MSEELSTLVTRDGRELKIAEMDTQHIRDCVWMLKRSFKKWQNEKINLNVVQFDDGDWDYNFITLLVARLKVGQFFPVIVMLQEELAKRTRSKI